MFMKIMQIGNNFIVFLSLLAVTQSFYFSTLEEYYIGGLYLGIGNGVTDGSVLLIGLFLFTGYYGSQPWLYIVDIAYAG
jgi:hypothetical protein